MTPQEAAKELNRRAVDLKKKAERAQKDAAKAAVDDLKKLSKGGYSLVTLARLGHPYSARNPGPPLPAGIINYQGGNLYRSWRRRYSNSGGAMLATVWNVSKEAAFLDPYLRTSRNKSIARPIAAYVVKDLKQVYPALIRARVREALKI